MRGWTTSSRTSSGMGDKLKQAVESGDDLAGRVQRPRAPGAARDVRVGMFDHPVKKQVPDV